MSIAILANRHFYPPPTSQPEPSFDSLQQGRTSFSRKPARGRRPIELTPTRCSPRTSDSRLASALPFPMADRLTSSSQWMR